MMNVKDTITLEMLEDEKNRIVEFMYDRKANLADIRNKISESIISDHEFNTLRKIYIMQLEMMLEQLRVLDKKIIAIKGSKR